MNNSTWVIQNGKLNSISQLTNKNRADLYLQLNKNIAFENYTKIKISFDYDTTSMTNDCLSIWMTFTGEDSPEDLVDTCILEKEKNHYEVIIPYKEAGFSLEDFWYIAFNSYPLVTVDNIRLEPIY